MEKGKIIGLVGGVGPLAGIDLQNKIASQTVAQTDQDHLTVISISQPSRILDRTQFLQGEIMTNPALALAKQVVQLSKMGAHVVGIPCNTAHAPPIFDLLRARLREENCPILLLHMIAETAVYMQTTYPTIKTIGILSTTGTYHAQIYPQQLESLGITAVIPDLTMQETLIHPAIYNLEYGIKAQGVTTKAQDNLREGVRALQKQGAEAIILGCTEIPLALPETKIGSTICVDPTRILARALIREANAAKLRVE